MFFFCACMFATICFHICIFQICTYPFIHASVFSKMLPIVKTWGSLGWVIRGRYTLTFPLFVLHLKLSTLQVPYLMSATLPLLVNRSCSQTVRVQQLLLECLWWLLGPHCWSQKRLYYWTTETGPLYAAYIIHYYHLEIQYIKMQSMPGT